MKMRGDQHPLVNPCVQTKGASSTIFLNDTHRESRSLKVANQASWTATQTTSINDESYKVGGPEIDRLVLMDVGLACSDGWRIYFEALAAKKRTGLKTDQRAVMYALRRLRSESNSRIVQIRQLNTSTKAELGYTYFCLLI